MDTRTAKQMEDGCNKTNASTFGVASSTTKSGPTPLLRPSSFVPGGGARGFGSGGVIAPARTFVTEATGGAATMSNLPFTSNPWQSNTGEHVDSSTDITVIKSNVLVSSSVNPFAERVSQASVSTPNLGAEDDRRGRAVVAPSHFASSFSVCATAKFGGGTTSTTKSLLKPSALDKQTIKFNSPQVDINAAPKTTFKFEPPKLGSPFALKKGESNKENEKTTKSLADVSESSEASSSVSEEASRRLFGDVPATSAPEPWSKQEAEEEKPMADTTTASTATESTEQKEEPNKVTTSTEKEEPAFVFGQNMQERATVTTSTESSSSSAVTSSYVFGEQLADRVELPSSSPANNGATSGDTSPVTDKSVSSSVPTLEESAAAQQAKQERPEFDEVEVKTGEENESNVFQLNAKLYAFDKEKQNWCEKGRGALRLNDMTTDNASFQSRLVMRAQGSLRVILNTKVWAAQTIVRANQRSIKISAWDIEENSIKIFLIQANPKDADQIFSAIDWRIQQRKVEEQETAEATATQKEAVEKKSEASVRRHVKKRRPDGEDIMSPKKQRVDSDPRKLHHAEESNDSSTVDPETEASNESFASSPTVKSTSSDN